MRVLFPESPPSRPVPQKYCCTPSFVYWLLSAFRESRHPPNTSSSTQFLKQPAAMLVILQSRSRGCRTSHDIPILTLTTAKTKNHTNRRKSVAAIPPTGTSALSATFHPSTVSQHSIPFKSAQAHLEFLSPVLPQKTFSVHLNVKFPSVLSKTKSYSSLVDGGYSDSHSSTHWAGPEGL